MLVGSSLKIQVLVPLLNLILNLQRRYTRERPNPYNRARLSVYKCIIYIQDRRTGEVRSRWGGQDSVQAVDGGCITSTPKTTDFVKKQRFCPKYERSSCMPGAKNGERPYPEAPKWTFWDPCLGVFFYVCARDTAFPPR